MKRATSSVLKDVWHIVHRQCTYVLWLIALRQWDSVFNLHIQRSNVWSHVLFDVSEKLVLIMVCWCENWRDCTHAHQLGTNRFRIHRLTTHIRVNRFSILPHQMQRHVFALARMKIREKTNIPSPIRKRSDISHRFIFVSLFSVQFREFNSLKMKRLMKFQDRFVKFEFSRYMTALFCDFAQIHIIHRLNFN